VARARRLFSVMVQGNLGVIFLGLWMALTAQVLFSRQSFRFASEIATVLRASTPPEVSERGTNNNGATPQPPAQPPTPPPPPRAPRPRRRSRPAPSPQPDEVRTQVLVHEMKCDEAIPPESISTTTEGENEVTIHARTHYKGETDDGLHGFGYTVEFANSGSTRIQLLTRHWVFVDANGVCAAALATPPSPTVCGPSSLLPPPSPSPPRPLAGD
jgi:hypothetical protein